MITIHQDNLQDVLHNALNISSSVCPLMCFTGSFFHAVAHIFIYSKHHIIYVKYMYMKFAVRLFSTKFSDGGQTSTFLFM